MAIIWAVDRDGKKMGVKKMIIYFVQAQNFLPDLPSAPVDGSEEKIEELVPKAIKEKDITISNKHLYYDSN